MNGPFSLQQAYVVASTPTQSTTTKLGAPGAFSTPSSRSSTGTPSKANVFSPSANPDDFLTASSFSFTPLAFASSDTVEPTDSEKENNAGTSAEANDASNATEETANSSTTASTSQSASTATDAGAKTQATEKNSETTSTPSSAADGTTDTAAAPKGDEPTLERESGGMIQNLLKPLEELVKATPKEIVQFMEDAGVSIKNFAKSFAKKVDHLKDFFNAIYPSESELKAQQRKQSSTSGSSGGMGGGGTLQALPVATPEAVAEANRWYPTVTTDGQPITRERISALMQVFEKAMLLQKLQAENPDPLIVDELESLQNELDSADPILKSLIPNSLSLLGYSDLSRKAEELLKVKADFRVRAFELQQEDHKKKPTSVNAPDRQSKLQQLGREYAEQTGSNSLLPGLELSQLLPQGWLVSNSNREVSRSTTSAISSGSGGTAANNMPTTMSWQLHPDLMSLSGA